MAKIRHIAIGEELDSSEWVREDIHELTEVGELVVSAPPSTFYKIYGMYTRETGDELTLMLEIDTDPNPGGGMSRRTIEYNMVGEFGVPLDLDDVPDGNTYKRMSATEQTKLSGIEDGSTVYPDTGEQAFLDADRTKLDGIEAGATQGGEGHPEVHTIASHSDTAATGAELEELTDGGETTLHSHAGGGGGGVATGGYTGNATNDRQITTGFQCAFVLLMRQDETNARTGWELLPNQTSVHCDDLPYHNFGRVADTYLHALDGFVVDNSGAYPAAQTSNDNGAQYQYCAMAA